MALKKIRDFIQRASGLNTMVRKQSISSMAHEDIQAYQLISSFLPDKDFYTFTSMSLTPSVIAHLFNEIAILGRKHILELGSGTSTLLLASFIKQYSPSSKILCVDDNEKWLKIIERMLEEKGTKDFVTLIHAPLSHFTDPNNSYYERLWYDQSILDNALKEVAFDLIVVDGPSGSLSPDMRYPIVPFLMERNLISDSYAVFLDDTYRKDEAKFVKSWQKALDARLRSYSRYSYLTNKSEDIKTLPYYLGYNYVEFNRAQ